MTTTVLKLIGGLAAILLVVGVVQSRVLQSQSGSSGQSESQSAKEAVGDEKNKPVEKPFVLMTTNFGQILLELDPEKAPVTVKNFLSYADKEFYDGTIFHRVISHFVIQGGGFTTHYFKKDTDDPIVNEYKNGLKNERGTIAMARDRLPDTATSQFFINVVDNASLDTARPLTGNAGYAVFGKVVVGMDVVDQIRILPTGAAGPFRSNVPQKPALIESVRRISSAQAAEVLAESNAKEKKAGEAKANSNNP